ncbi:S-layer region-like protein [Trichormus variabilis ATCC 29413]|uniref:S-layer region-like protein n=2 Tax=Anabaena variabilis TaxID=264691 RepID=Q3M4F2_TRIV2|nr:MULTISPECIES: iron uptake porin [Nostocaceae]ABA24134.1 S-layer region-like protein [Trichormus variabilis ATCC 29413]MBC1215217.1 carbohydrate porin [Trichormus variabilis ARAD]MBC1266267.1 carbohydrate porin [Trichormus variabilis FSR]MBC1302006.1 carbohydrate porin [Trichormus variabilis N2B]MBC1311452.1 carbohydrate porin [Trichormus variabilis PNB]
MAKYLLASAGGAGFLWLFCGLFPVQAITNLNNSDKNLEIAQNNINHKNIDSLVSQELTQKDLTSSNQPQKSENLDSDNTINSLPLIIQESTNSSPPSDQLAQVTSVSQLSDVQPTDWAFGALQSLVERYGCIAGYPNLTYRGNRAMTRYEFAAGLNACLDRINELIATATADLVKKEDLATLQKLQEQFAAELATLRGRVDALEARTTELEANQFSTTTKLNGEAIIAAIGATGGAPGSNDSNLILVNRVRLNLTTSFTGKDLLITGLQAYNFLGGATGEGSVQNSLGLGSPILSSSSARTSFEPQFPGLNVKNLSSVGANSLELYKLLYIFPVADKLTLFVGTAAETSDAFPAITPFYGEGQESISRFAGLNPVVRVSGGTSGSGLASAAGFIYSISPNLDFRALYGSVNANLPQKSPTEALPGVSTTPLGAGFFSGSSVIAAQLTFKPSRDIDIGLNYANSYHEINILGTGLISGDIGALSGVSPGTPVKLNSFGGTVTWRFSPKVALSGYGAALFVDDSANNVDASTTFTSWMAGVHFKDLFKSGNNGGIIFGQPLYRTDASGAAVLGSNRATPYHLEAYYRVRVSDNISITPGAFILFNPEGDSRNETTTVGVLRTTFTF